ncbi:MAG TPA: type I DNA topoisomerase [Acidimicrobiales bacterium]|nr:type I DNA topoisomerase [Acidimicrobiales bacterium]
MAKPLVIVESPAKARTIARFLGSDFLVESSVGHVRDLPRTAADVPPAYKGESWARLGVDVEAGFKPLYVVAPEKKQVVTRLRQLLKQADELYLATDEDREGESIAWHLLEVLSPPARVPVKRMVFHEITPSAIRDAVEHTRDLDRRLVDAQEARRILDRLYGYEVSPVLWKKVLPKLSAGRVQSVATRILVERERARMRFKPAAYSGVEGTFAPAGGASADEDGQQFGATLVALDGTRLATGRDFGETGTVIGGTKIVVLDHDAAVGLAERLGDARFAVRSVDEKPYRRSPYPPFLTSTLQQEAGRKLRFTSQRTMSVAQRLYENGYITYMRTDSTALSDTAIAAARAQATQLYGRQYVPDQPRRYEKKVKNAQEAHEAIRPAGETFRTPDEVAAELAPDELALYDLIWKRTVASQMADARGKSVQVRLGATSSAGEDAEFAGSGKVIEFPGFLRAYVEGSDDPDARLEDREVRLPALAAGDGLDALALEATDHTTQPPPRFTEASLVKALEELGVGRPSTYASIIATIQERGYVWKKGAALVPSFTAFAVVQLLEHHFADLVDYAFTARMEDDLDGIAAGQEEAQPWLSRFYFGNGRGGLKAMVDERLDAIDAKAVNSIPIGTDAEGRQIVVRVGRYGPYLSRGEETAALPDDLPPDELTVERAEELLAKPSSDRVLGTDPETGLPVIARAGRYGPYVQLGEGDAGAKQKPRTSSLLSGMTLDSVTLDDALKLLSLPRVVGVDPADGEEISVHNGRYGPYVKKGSDSRSLGHDDQLFSLTLDEALRILAQPRRGRGQKAAAGPLRQLGTDPVSAAPIELREGRFGPYVTDGTTNASLRTGDDPESITLERAAELLQDRRERGPAKPRRGRVKKTVKKTQKATKAAKAAKAAKGSSKGAKRAKPAKPKAGSSKGRSSPATGTEA